MMMRFHCPLRPKVELFYIQPLMLDVPAPSREKSAARLGEIVV